MRKGRFNARMAGQGDMDAVLALRAQQFRGGCEDADAFDTSCLHGLVEDADTQQVVSSFRALPLASGADIAQSHAAGVYDLSGLSEFGQPMLEIGRICVAPGANHPDILRLTWALLARVTDRFDAALLFGCASFAGTDPRKYSHVFAYLKAHHRAPSKWAPRQRAAHIFALDGVHPGKKADLALCPALLRMYVTMGGWVSDHGVVDHDLGTLHVFTALEVAKILPSRRASLRAESG
ncbi:MAG: GNAT family N-acyltransferase [Pseudomonadota bacterium]